MYYLNNKYDRQHKPIWTTNKLHETLTEIKEEITLSFRLAKPKESSNVIETILIATILSLLRVSVYSSVFNVNRGNNQFTFREDNENNSFNVNSTGEISLDAGTIVGIIRGSYELSELIS